MATLKNTIDLILQAAPVRILGVPSNNAVPIDVIITDNSNGTRDITFIWSYSQGLIKADTIGLLWNESAVAMPVAPAYDDCDGGVTLNIDRTSYTFQGVDPERFYRVGIVVGQKIDTGYYHGPVVSPSASPDWRITAGTSNNTNNIGGTPASSIGTAIINFNNSNDRDGSAITIAPSALSLNSVFGKVGSYDVTLSWNWTGVEGDIDGFGIYAHQGTTNAAYTLGQPSDTIFQVRANARSFTWFGVAPEFWYTVGVLAYRKVDSDIDASGVIISGLTQATAYQPNPNPNITASVGGVTSTNVANSWNYAASMLDDNVLSAGAEKAAMRSGWDNVTATRAGLIAQATALGVSSTAYQTAYQNLANYLHGSAWTSGIPLYVSDASMPVNTSLNGATGRALIAALESETYALQNALDAKAATTAIWNTVTSKPANIYNTNDAETYGLNPTFGNWTGTYPDGWVGWNGAAPTKETSIKKLGDFAVRYVCTGADTGMYRSINIPAIPADSLVTGSVDIFLNASASGLPGLYIVVYNEAGTAAVGSAMAQQMVANPGYWNKVPFSVRGNNIDRIGAIVIYIMGSWVAFPSGGFTGTAIFDNFQFSITKGTDTDNKRQPAADIQGQIDAATQLLNNSLTAVKTNLAGINPTTGNISASQASVISGFFANLAAINANLGTVTAGSITGTANLLIGGSAVFNGSYSVAGYSAAVAANTSGAQSLGVYGQGTVGGYFVGNTDGITAIANGAGKAVYGIANNGGIGGYFSGSQYGVYCASALYIAGAATFAGTVNMSGGASSTTQVTNLNAHYLQGNLASAFATASHPHNGLCPVIVTNSGTANITTGGFSFASTVAGTRTYSNGSNYVEIQSTSDSRIKQNIEPEILGIDFIKALKPVSYRMKANPLLKYHGFIAQDLHNVIGGDFTDSLKQQHLDGIYGLDYVSLIAPIVNALQNIVTRLENLENNNG